MISGMRQSVSRKVGQKIFCDEQNLQFHMLKRGVECTDMKIWKCKWKECAKDALLEESGGLATGGPERLHRQYKEKTHITPGANK
jgi:hypothetical protein